MKAIVCERHGLPEQLVYRELPDPVPGPGDLLVRIRASGVNFPDALLIQGRYQAQPALPFIPGSEAAGIVQAIGAGVTGFAPGDRVSVITSSGSFAQMALAPAATAIHLPDDIPFEFAAVSTVTYGTAYLALLLQAQLRKGETVLVLGAAGGVGIAAIEIAKAKGAVVIAAASSATKLNLAREAGADHFINYELEDLKSTARALTEGRGVDIVVDPVGDRFAEPAIRALNWGGRYLIVGFAAGAIPRVPLNLLLLKSASAIGVFYGEWMARNPAVNHQHAESLFAMYRRGEISGMISQRYPLADAPAALRWMIDRNAVGKLVIDI